MTPSYLLTPLPTSSALPNGSDVPVIDEETELHFESNDVNTNDQGKFMSIATSPSSASAGADVVVTPRAESSQLRTDSANEIRFIQSVGMIQGTTTTSNGNEDEQVGTLLVSSVPVARCLTIRTIQTKGRGPQARRRTLWQTGAGASRRLSWS